MGLKDICNHLLSLLDEKKNRKKNMCDVFLHVYRVES